MKSGKLEISNRLESKFRSIFQNRGNRADQKTLFSSKIIAHRQFESKGLKLRKIDFTRTFFNSFWEEKQNIHIVTLRTKDQE